MQVDRCCCPIYFAVQASIISSHGPDRTLRSAVVLLIAIYLCYINAFNQNSQPHDTFGEIKSSFDGVVMKVAALDNS